MGDILHFRSTGKEFGLPLLSVSEVATIDTSDITVVPGSAPFILGVCNLRGQIVTLVDLESYLQHSTPAHPLERRRSVQVLLLDSDEVSIAIVAEEVPGVLQVTEESGERIEAEESEFVSHMLQRPDTEELLLLLEADNLVKALQTSHQVANLEEDLQR